MSRYLWISGAAACLVIGAGFLLAEKETASAAVPTKSAVVAKAAAEPSVRIVWPTPYPYFKDGADPARWLQATESGRVGSGGYGMVRDGGARFHEGVDIRPVAARDKRGEPTDIVVAAIAGRIMHANTVPNGAYGRYVVLEHRLGGMTLYTLYAHLASLDPATRVGRTVAEGAALGVMGRSDAKGGFPKERAHLHFEVGLRLSSRFDRWYAGRRYPDPNLHGQYNGINLAGLNPVAFFNAVRVAGGEPTVKALEQWVASNPVAVLADVPVAGTPDFVTRHPGLVVGNAAKAAGWRVGFTADGVPVRWEPLATAPKTLTIVAVDAASAIEARRCGLVVPKKRGVYAPGSKLETALELAAGL